MTRVGSGRASTSPFSLLTSARRPAAALAAGALGAVLHGAVLLGATLLVAWAPPAGATGQEIILPRFPAPSPDGTRIAFCYQGDIWVVPCDGGEAIRLTAHPAYDERPIWSPDGAWIAFTSSRDGNEDVYVLPVAGGEVRRLTWYSGTDHATGWTPDSKAVLFEGRRQIREWGAPGTFVVSLDGDLPVAVLPTSAEMGVLSPDGTRLAYTRGSTPWWTRGYEGNARFRLWIGELPEALGKSGERARDAIRPPALPAPSDGRPQARWDGPPCTDAGLNEAAALFPQARHLNLTALASITQLPGGDPLRGYLATYLDGPPDASRPEIEVGSNLWPQWFPDGDHLLYWSEYHGFANLKLVSASTGARAWVTQFAGGRLRFPTLSQDGRLVAFEYEDGIYTVRLPAPPPPGSAAWGDGVPGEPQRVRITLPVEGRPSDYVRKHVTSEASQFVLSPDDKQIAFVCDGEVFALKAAEDEPSAYRLTDTPARDDEIAWAPDSKSLAFVSDRSGTRDIYRVRSQDEQEPRLARSLRLETVRLTDRAEDDHRPLFSPDGSKIAFERGLGTLMVMDADGSHQEILADGFTSNRYKWSPDSKWIVFDREDSDFNRDVFIVSADGEVGPHNISRHPDDDYAPFWSADGKVIAFVSRRAFFNQTDIWYVWLTREDEERSREDRLEALSKEDARGSSTPDGSAFTDGRDDEDDDKGDDGAESKKDDDGEKEAKIPTVRIDFEDIHKRLHRLTTFPGAESEVLVAKDGKGFVFVADTEGKRDLWWVKWDGSDPKQITKGGQDPRDVQFNKKGTRVFYRKGGTITSIPVDGGEAKTFGYEGQMEIDRAAQRSFVFEEAWRSLGAQFYDADHHGTDWRAAHDKFRPWALAASSYRDFHDAIRMMIGELNSSHLGIWGGPDDWSNENGAADTGDLGVLFDPHYAGPGLRILRVIQHSAADREESRLQEGEILLAINGVNVSRASDPFRFLDGTVDHKVLLRVRGRDGAEREVSIRPGNLTTTGQLLYEEEIAARQRFVEEHSGGRVAYIHVDAMGSESLDLYERDLYAQAHGADALLIDVRGNGGGWTTDLLLTSLMAGDHAVTQARGGGPGYPHDRRLLYAWTKPIVVLCNEHSYSNAEIFAWAIRTLQRGPVVGQPTHGAVISTDGTTLGDGSYLRLPFRGWTSRMNGANLEGTGCMPDIVVENRPDELARGIDRQLERALEEALARLR
jgi:tricorn protease